MADYAIGQHQASVNRACRLMGLSRSVYHYKPKLAEDNEIRDALILLAEKHPRYGFGKLFPLLRRQGYGWNHKRVYRVYCALKLNLQRRPKKRLPSRQRIALSQPSKANISWSLDFMSDALANGRRFRTVNVLDDFNREALGIKPDFWLPAQQVISFLDQIAWVRGYPEQLRVDNGPENISKVMVEWATRHKIHIHYIQPGKPAQNAYIERFNRTYREEVLDMHLFTCLEQVQSLTQEWLKKYNGERPHESLGNLSPWQYTEKRLISTNSLY